MKHFDFLPNEQMDPVIALLHSMVVYNYQRLRGLVDGLTQEEIDYQGANKEFNSIAQLLRHLAVVDLHWVYRLRASNMPDELKEHYGPMYDEDGKLPQIKNVTLETLLEEYDNVQQLLKDACLQLLDEDLVRNVTFGNENEKTATIRWGIWHIADHSRHHYANIAHTKKILRK
jgi:uncharacterized damage-inducible protein DinB